MICKNCGKELRRHENLLTYDKQIGTTRLVGIWVHTLTMESSCGLYAEPIIKIDTRLDAKTILAEMAAREANKRAVSQPRLPNPDLVEGSFVGEL